MKIGQPTDLPQLSTGSPAASAPPQGGGAAAAGSAAAGAQQAAGVAVSVSSQVRSLAQAGSDAGEEVDMDKVNAVRNAIAQGSYKVNAEAIADKLLANAQEMLDRTRR